MTLYAILAAARSMVTNIYEDIFVDASICVSGSLDQVLSDLAKSTANAAMQNAEDDAEYAQFVEQYRVYLESVRCGKSGKTSQLWMSSCNV